MWKKPEVVAKELKRLVLARGTISQACNATSINRQQFNKYLAGQVLPGARNMRKICSYLGVSEEGLISEGPSLLPGDFVAQSENDLGAIAPGVGDLLKTARRNLSVAPPLQMFCQTAITTVTSRSMATTACWCAGSFR